MKKLLVIIAMVAFIALPMSAMADSSAEVNDVSADASITDNSSVAASIDSHDRVTTTNKSQSQRYLPNSGVTPIPGTNGFFTAPTPDSSFRSIKEIVKMDDPDATCLKVSEGVLEDWASGGDSDINYQRVRDKNRLARGNKDKDDIRWLNICIVAPEGFKSAAFVDGEADDGDTNMLQVLGEAGDEAIGDGVNTLVITAEGAHRAVEASGWGIGMYMLGSQLTSGGGTAGVMGGGTGYASNQTQTEDEPWFQGRAGMVSAK